MMIVPTGTVATHVVCRDVNWKNLLKSLIVASGIIYHQTAVSKLCNFQFQSHYITIFTKS